MGVKWSKAEVERVRGHIQGGALQATFGRQDMSTDWSNTWANRRATLRKDHALDMALLDLQVLAGVWEEYARKDREFLDHLAKGPGRCGYDDPAGIRELQDRFVALEKEHVKRAEGYRKLAQKLRDHGLPPELKT